MTAYLKSCNLLSSPAQRCGQVGGAADWIVHCSIGMEFQRSLEPITQAMKTSGRRWHMIVPTIIARHRAQSVACSSSRKFRETDATFLREKCLSYLSCITVEILCGLQDKGCQLLPSYSYFARTIRRRICSLSSCHFLRLCKIHGDGGFYFKQVAHS